MALAKKKIFKYAATDPRPGSGLLFKLEKQHRSIAFNGNKDRVNNDGITMHQYEIGPA